MATAVQTRSDPQTPSHRARLALAGLLGAAFFVAGVAVAGYLVPQAWHQYVTPAVAPVAGLPIDVALRWVAQLGVAAALVGVGSALAANPPHGIRGGIFLVISALIAIFFVVQAVGLNVEDSQYGLPITLVVLGGLLGLAFRLLVSPAGERWMLAIEDQGWLSTFNYKRTQGLKLRRYTLIGLLLIGGSGAYALYSHETLGQGNWTLALPFTGRSVTVLPQVGVVAPILLAAVTLWLAWRAVNVPNFADFLIATEAEMNKVSWSTRRRLLQDTVVVLVTVLLLTAFLLLVDLFWGWLLSQSFIGVLPSKSAAPVANPTQKLDW